MTDVQALMAHLPALAAKRDAAPPDSAVRHRYSNLVQQIKRLATYTRPAWAEDDRQTLSFMIKQQIAELQKGNAK